MGLQGGRGAGGGRGAVSRGRGAEGWDSKGVEGQGGRWAGAEHRAAGRQGGKLWRDRQRRRHRGQRGNRGREKAEGLRGRGVEGCQCEGLAAHESCLGFGSNRAH